jgi:hypothetical protein
MRVEGEDGTVMDLLLGYSRGCTYLSIEREYFLVHSLSLICRSGGPS